MRDKIDNLILINLLWFVVANCAHLVGFSFLYLGAILGGLFSIIYEFTLLSQIHKKVEKDFQTRMLKRVGYNMFFTIVFVLFTILNFIF